jgi:CheY-like chemotaxis protein
MRGGLVGPKDDRLFETTISASSHRCSRAGLVRCLYPIGSEAMNAKRVLVVEDNQDVRELVGECLQERCSVTLVEDGSSALEAITREPLGFDALVVDLDMPRMDGATLIEELRHRDIDLPLLIISGTPEIRTRARQVHAEFLTKPFEPSKLQREVDRLLQVA